MVKTRQSTSPLWVPSFRSEVGSAGRDTRGLIRLQPIHKVEMVKFAKPEESYEELEKWQPMLKTSFKNLNLPYRSRCSLSTGDMGFSAAKTYDLEVWFQHKTPTVKSSSCSNTEDFKPVVPKSVTVMKRWQGEIAPYLERFWTCSRTYSGCYSWKLPKWRWFCGPSQKLFVHTWVELKLSNHKIRFSHF